jgi:hypothetical protein
MQLYAEVLLVLFCTCGFTAALFYWVHAYRKLLMDKPLVITFVAFGWVILCLTFTTAVAFTAGDRSVGLFTTTSWYTMGWTSGLSLFSVRIDSWYRYLVVLLYQVGTLSPRSHLQVHHQLTQLDSLAGDTIYTRKSLDQLFSIMAHCKSSGMLLRCRRAQQGLS